jgi:putative transposase|tara:strand:- start:2908 stop:4902 length:1995 start_codon:yes stop_codon:yes gene_type:complete
MHSLMLEVGEQLEYRGVAATIRATQGDSIILKINETLSEITKAEFYQDVRSGIVNRVESELINIQPSPLATDADRALAQKYRDYLTPLDEEAHPCSKKTRDRVIDSVSARRGDVGKNKPSSSLLYSWYKKYSSVGVNRNITLMIKPCAKKRGRQASSEAIDLFDKVMDEHYIKPLSDGALNIANCYKEYQKHWQFQMSNTPENERNNLHGISRSVFFEMVRDINPVEVCMAREGSAIAAKRFRNSADHFVVDRPLERVQIDAVHLNLGLTDQTGNYIGMPVVFFAIDIFTRAIIGYVISYATQRREDLCSAIELIKCSILTKEKPAHTIHNWPLTGKPEIIQHDSGVFSSKMFQSFLAVAQVTPAQNPAKKPWCNAFIERFNGTFRAQCASKIPGYLGKKILHSDASKQVKNCAYATIDEFRQIIESFILDAYHVTPHRGLGGKTPMQMCEEFKHFVPTASLEYFHRLDTFHGIELEATIQGHKGIQKNSLYYNDREGKLQTLFNKLVSGVKGNPKVKFYYSTLDVSKISVFDPFKNDYIIIPCTSIKEPTSLEEVKARRTNKPAGEINTATTVGPIVEKITARKQEMENEKKITKALRSKSKKETELDLMSTPILETLDNIIVNNASGLNVPKLSPQPSLESLSNDSESQSTRRKRKFTPINL